MKTHGYLTICEGGYGVITQTMPQFEPFDDGGPFILDANGEPEVSSMSPHEVRRLFGERPVPEAPADKYPNGRTFIVDLREVE